MDFDGRMGLLADSLEASVAIRVLELHKMSLGEAMERLLAVAPGTAQRIASEGDKLMFRGGKAGETAKLFNEVAEAIALMSVVVPGGVKLFGREWNYPHPGLVANGGRG